MTITVTALGVTSGSGTTLQFPLTGYGLVAGDCLLICGAGDTITNLGVYRVGNLIGEYVPQGNGVTSTNAGNVVTRFGMTMLTRAPVTGDYAFSNLGSTAKQAISVYKVTGIGVWTNLWDETAGTSTTLLFGGFNTRSGEQIWLAKGTLTSLDFELAKSGSPTGTAYVRVYNGAGTLIDTLGTIDVSTLTTSFVWYSFSGSVAVPEGYNVRIVIEYSGGDASNYILTRDRWTGAADNFKHGNTCEYSGTTWRSRSGDCNIRYITGLQYLNVGIDVSAAATGSSASPSSGATATLSQASELVVGAIGVEDNVEDIAGSWTTGASNVSGNEQQAGTSGGGGASNIVVRSAAEIVSATTAQTAAITSMASADWAAAIATFKGVLPVSFIAGHPARLNYLRM